MAWRPLSNDKTDYVLISTHIYGRVLHSYAFNSKPLFSSKLEGDLEAYSVCYTPDSSKYVLGLSNNKVRVFDDKRRTKWNTLDDTFYEHTNKVLGLVPIDNSTIISSSWDCSFIVWDLRTESSVQKFYGPSATSRSYYYI